VQLSVTLSGMSVGDIIEKYAGSYVVVTAKRTNEPGKIKVTVLDERGQSHTWTDRPNLRTPDRYLKVGEDCDTTVDALNEYAGKYLRK